MSDFTDIIGEFAIPGRFTGAVPWGKGHINDTYAGTWTDGEERSRYIHQRINTEVFRSPEKLMENIKTVTDHLNRKSPDNRSTLEIIPARDGAPFVVDGEKNFWRTFRFIEDTISCELPETPAQVFEAAAAFGRFQRALSDLSFRKIHEILPNFHHTVNRLNNLKRSIASDRLNRAVQCSSEIRFILKHEDLICTIVDLLAQQKLPLRIIHNDTKLNNVLLDALTLKGVCVIDLDTVMPGSALYDFGDLVRTAANNGKEDERDLDRVFLRIDMFEAVTRGYLYEAKNFLTDLEMNLLATGAELMTMENGIRFLEDFLEGDRYFKTSRPMHNLERARVQLRLFRSMEKNSENMEKIIRRSVDRP